MMKKNYLYEKDEILRIFIFLGISFLVLFLSGSAFATDPTPTPSAQTFEDKLCALVRLMDTTLAKVLATMAIFAAGVGFLLGKFNWVQTLTVAIGVIVVFYSPELVNLISGSSDTTCSVRP